MADHSESVQANRDEIEHEQTIRSEKFLCELKAHLDAAMLKHEQLLQDAVAAARSMSHDSVRDRYEKIIENSEKSAQLLETRIKKSIEAADRRHKKYLTRIAADRTNHTDADYARHQEQLHELDLARLRLLDDIDSHLKEAAKRRNDILAQKGKASDHHEAVAARRQEMLATHRSLDENIRKSIEAAGERHQQLMRQRMKRAHRLASPRELPERSAEISVSELQLNTPRSRPATTQS